MPSIAENPEQFFNELSTPKEEKPSPAPVPEKPVVSEENPSKEASITENPSAFFDNLSTPVEPVKKETTQSVFLGQVAGKKPEQLENFDIQSLNSLQPEELHDVAMSRKDIPLTDEQLRSVYDFHKAKTTSDQNYGTPTSLREFMDMTNRWAEPIGEVGNDIAHTLWQAANGAGKLAYRTADYVTTPDMDIPDNRKFYTPEQQEELRKQKEVKGKAVEDAYQSAADPIVGMPEELAWMGSKIGAGGMDWFNRASEALGFQDHEKSFQNFKARRAVEAAQAQYYQEHPTAVGRVLDLPIVKQGLESIVKSDLPTSDEWMATHPHLSREQAQQQIDAIAKDHVENSLKESESRIAATDPDIATASSFLAPEGLGMGTMGALGMGVRAAGELTPKIAQGLKYLGKTDAEINAMYSAAQEVQNQAAQKALQEISQPSLLEKAAGKTANAIDWTTAFTKGLTEKIPEPIRPFVPYVAGGAAGGIYGHEQGRSVIGDVLHGIEIAGLLKAPALARDIEEARRISAGGTKGTFETMGGFPNVSTGAAKILRAGGKNIDNLLSNAAEYAKSGIHATALAVATGVLDSASPEEMNNLVSQGLIYGLGGHAFERIKGGLTGYDPILENRKKAQQDVDNLRTFANLSPESQQTLKDVTSWNNVVENQQQKANDARIAYLDAVERGSKDAPERKKEWQAQTNALSSVMRANVQTRNEYGRLFVDQLSRNSNLVNGTLKAGQNNVGVHILTPEQIYQKFRQDPANATKSDAEVREAADQAGFYSTPEGAIEYKSGMGMEAPKKDLVFDRTKPSIVINADHLKARMKLFGESANQALNHEFGHHVANIPEFREANKDAESLLFSQEIKDPSGAVVATTNGRYSPKDLVDMYENNYMKGKTPEQIEQISKLVGAWDYSRQALDENAVAAYMKDEILADLNAETLSNHLGKDLDSGTMHLMDLARIKTKKNLLDRAVNKFAGLGGKGDAVSPLTGAEFSPEVMASNRQAMRALQSLQGEVSPAVAAPEAPKISRSEMMKNRALQERAKYSGLFKTKVQAQIYDGNGKPIGGPVDIENPNVAEGSWQNKNGSLRQLTGYGQRPDELMGVEIPEGGSLVVGRQIVREADGVTPVMMSPKEAKQLQKDRVKVVREALNTPDEGAPNRFEPTGDPDGTWRGTFTPFQIEAIKNLPEGIVPKSIKEKMLKINDMIVKGDGSRLLADYAAVMNDNGRYTPYAAKIYDLVPIGMHLSKDGHFLATTISVGRMFDKLNKWSERMPARLAPWGGSKDAFFKEFTEKYLQNWQNGVAGETGLAGTPAEALAKKNIFNDFLNLTTKDTAPLNPDRTKTPRRRGDVRGKDIDRTIMSVRLDHIAELMENENAPKVPVSYQKAKFNLMPKPEEGEEALKPLTFAPKGDQPALTPDILKGISAVHVPATKKYPTSEKGFYSGLQKTIDDKMPTKASPDQILSIVNNPQNAKPEEVKWSNLAGFLEGKKSVTKQEVLDYLKNEGSVKFEEKTLGEPSAQQAERDSIAISEKYGYTSEYDPHSEQYTFKDKNGEDVDFQDLPSKMQIELVENTNKIDRQKAEPKYSQYTLPNGENYREVVLTMPEATADLDKIAQSLFGKNYSELDGSNFKTPQEAAQARVEVKREARKQGVEIPETYTSSHFSDIPNYVAHMRLNERKDADDKDGLFIEELQSDRHQQGREQGYQLESQQEANKRRTEAAKKADAILAGRSIGDLTYEEKVEWNRLQGEASESVSPNKGVPDAPFRKDWSVQMFKRALRDAIFSGKEWIGWTNRDTQAERYDLSKQVDALKYVKMDDGTYKVQFIPKGRDGEWSTLGNNLKDTELADNVGKEIAEKIANGEGEKDSFSGSTILRGVDLKVGGEGMKGFYDQILPKEIGKYVKKWGAKVEEGAVSNPDEAVKGLSVSSDGKEFWLSKGQFGQKVAGPFPDYISADNARAGIAKGQTPIWKVEITPEMRESIQQGGQIQFMPKREEEPERITEATYTNPRTGEVTRGISHRIANPNAPQEATDRESPAYGFATDKGRIVDRNEAYNIAKQAGQLKTPATEEEKFHADRGMLHSGMYEPKGISFMPAAGESKPVPTQEELDKMKARLPKYSSEINKDGNKYFVEIYNDNDDHVASGSMRIDKSANYAKVISTKAPEEYKSKGYGEALYREIAKIAQKENVDRIYSDSVTFDARKVRNKLFGSGYDIAGKLYGSEDKNASIEQMHKVPSGISFMPSQLDSAHAKAIESGDTEEAQRLVDEAARKAGYDLSHREGYGQDWRKKEDVILFAKWEPSEMSRNDHYGPANYIIKSSDLKPVPEWAIKWHSTQPEIVRAAKEDKRTALEIARDSMNPNDIVDGAGMWDNRESVRDFYNDNESRLYKEGTIGYLTPDGAVIFDPYSAAEKGIAKLADPATYDNQGNLIPLSQRFNPASNDIRFMPANELPKNEDGSIDWEGFKTKAQETAKPLAALAPIGGISFMPEPKDAKQVDKGDENSLPVYQKMKNGKPVLKKGDPVYVQEKYNLVNAPAINQYNGPAAEDPTPFDFKSLAYDVTGPQQKKIDAAIASGAVDHIANQVVEKTQEYLKNPEIAAGKGWYSRMRKNLLDALGEDGRELVSQLLGATSAKTPVNQNFLQAMDGYEGIKNGRYDENRKSYLEMLDAQQKGELANLIRERGYVDNVKQMADELSKGARKLKGKKKQAALDAAKDLRDLIKIPEENRTPKQNQKIMMLATNMIPMRSNGRKFNANSLAVLKVIGGTWLANRKSPKTPNFAGNLSGRTIQATIDVWAARFLRQIMFEGYGKPWRIQPKSETGVSNEDFALGQIILKRAADKLEMNPDDLQAVLWFAEKHNWDQRGWTKNEGAEKSSFDEIFHVFFPKGKKPLSFAEASKVFAEMNEEEDINATDEEEND